MSRQVRPGVVARVVLALLLAATGLVTTATTAHGGTTPPTVSALLVASATVEDGRLRLSGRVAAADADSGLDRVVVVALEPTGRRDEDRLVGQAVVRPQFPGRATLDEGFVIAADDPRTSSVVLRVVAFDRAGNVARWDAAELEALGLPAVVALDGATVLSEPAVPPAPTPVPGGQVPVVAVDRTPPELRALEVAEPERREDADGDPVVWLSGTLAALDDGDGLDRVVVAAFDANGSGLGAGTARPQRAGARTMDASWAFPVVRPDPTDSFPTRAFLRVTAYDLAGNVASWGVAELVAVGWTGVVTLVEPTPEVAVPPAPVAPTSPPAADPDPARGPQVLVSGATVARLAGADRGATAAAVAAAGWPDGADHVVVATGRTFPDALAAAPFAARRGAPVLLATADAAALAGRVAALGASSATVVGGVAAVDPGAVAAMQAAGVAVERIAGEDRYATAALLATSWETSDVVWVASGASSADALAAGAAAARRGEPLLLTAPGRLPDATRSAVERLGPRRVLLVGGPAAVDVRVEDALAGIAPVQRVAGADRWATAVAVARVGWASDVGAPLREGIGADRAMLALGTGFADAVAGAPLAARGWGPVLLTRRDALPAPTAAALGEATTADGLDRVTLLGGEAALADTVRAQVTALLP